MRLLTFILLCNFFACSAQQQGRQRGVYLSANYELDTSSDRCTKSTQSETWAVVMALTTIRIMAFLT